MSGTTIHVDEVELCISYYRELIIYNELLECADELFWSHIFFDSLKFGQKSCNHNIFSDGLIGLP